MRIEENKMRFRPSIVVHIVRRNAIFIVMAITNEMHWWGKTPIGFGLLVIGA
ncbi:hypothetical protein HPK10_08100 [Anoxybacillus flavithermus]|nr:hypothetical protein [Anoxybacillus flavithermus]MBE2943129.1 hypothetical protein [Anoxybacillus flavithermus]MBE2951460.1 hypothetical protein [Anoxybacillus flavithermus]MBE2954028.1 hypothetical protein [Anoxybacillus flavithermus]MBE2959491.1 hypothetical protein [Anoxybacillus flavithermus]